MPSARDACICHSDLPGNEQHALTKPSSSHLDLGLDACRARPLSHATGTAASACKAHPKLRSQLSTGGRGVLDNQRLVHQACNGDHQYKYAGMPGLA